MILERGKRIDTEKTGGMGSRKKWGYSCSVALEEGGECRLGDNGMLRREVEGAPFGWLLFSVCSR